MEHYIYNIFIHSITQVYMDGFILYVITFNINYYKSKCTIDYCTNYRMSKMKLAEFVEE